MRSLNEKTLQAANLKLLVVFAVLMRERSVTRAAEQLSLSQPAVSHSLKGLRAMFGDELFTRVYHGIVPTLRV
jgi:LysR family transcriptional regulator, mexEF-oprN operon transcriptional activator